MGQVAVVGLEDEQEWLCLLLWRSPPSDSGVLQRGGVQAGHRDRPQEPKSPRQQMEQPPTLHPNREWLEQRTPSRPPIEEWQVAVHVLQVLSINGRCGGRIEVRRVSVHEQEPDLLRQRDLRHIRGRLAMVEVQGGYPLWGVLSVCEPLQDLRGNHQRGFRLFQASTTCLIPRFLMDTRHFWQKTSHSSFKS